MTIKKVFVIFLVVILIGLVLTPKTFALKEVIDNGKGFLDAGKQDVVDVDAVESTNTKIYNILLGVGVAVAVIIGAVLGIQFIFGSVEGKAKIAEALVPYIVGCFVVFGAFGIWKIAVNAGKSITKDDKKQTQLTPGVSGYKCKFCGKDVGEIPSICFTGTGSFDCPHCHKKVIDAGKMVGLESINQNEHTGGGGKF